MLALIWVYKTFSIDHYVCLKMCRRVKTKKSTRDVRLKQDKQRIREILDLLEISSVFLSLSSSLLFISYWAFSNEVQYILLSAAFLAMAIVFFNASFWRKLLNLRMKRINLEKQQDKEGHIDTFNNHLGKYQLLFFIDTLWFVTVIILIYGMGKYAAEVFNNPDRPAFCL